MKLRLRGKRGWLGKLFCGAVLGLGIENAPLHAQMLLPPTTGTEAVPPAGGVAPIQVVDPSLSAGWFAGTPYGDPCAPAWCDPVSRVPNLFGGFFARGLQASQANPPVPLHFTGVGAEGNFFSQINAPVTLTGPKGPYTLLNNIPLPNPPVFPVTSFVLPQNGEFTPQVQMNFPGASFVGGGGTVLDQINVSFFYDYLVNGGRTTVALPNPAGGGLVGRNLYFENGSALPQDRVYFFYNYVGNFQLPGYAALDINRFVFGFEKTFFDGRLSVEARIPFAGTLDRDQTAGQGLAVDNPQFGNVGLVLKGLIYRTPNFAASVGLGVSLPTAGDSRMYVGGTPVLAIENRTCLLQPLLGLAWAPNDRFYAQAGLQFDLDPSGNPVQGLDANGGLSRIGVLNDQSYAFLNTAVGYWIYKSTGRLTGVALQSELDYYRSFGAIDSVQVGNLSVTDLTNPVNVLNLTPGVILEFSQRARLSLGVSVPVTRDRLYNWMLTAQVNYSF